MQQQNIRVARSKASLYCQFMFCGYTKNTGSAINNRSTLYECDTAYLNYLCLLNNTNHPQNNNKDLRNSLDLIYVLCMDLAWNGNSIKPPYHRLLLVKYYCKSLGVIGDMFST